MLATDPDYICLKRYDYSLLKLLERYKAQEQVPDHVIAAALLMSEDEVDALYGEIVWKLRVMMGVTDEN